MTSVPVKFRFNACEGIFVFTFSGAEYGDPVNELVFTS